MPIIYANGKIIHFCILILYTVIFEAKKIYNIITMIEKEI